jgi:PPOX class probable F420-dependent enzyme
MRLNAAECRDRFMDAGRAVLAINGAAGPPLIVPITFEIVRTGSDDGDGDVVVSAVDHKPKSTSDLRRLRLIEADPRVALLVDRYDHDWDRLWWVRADAQATILSPGQDSDLGDVALPALTRKYPVYRRQPPMGALIWMVVDRWSGWAAATG